jgi:hypothetical protein
MRVGTKIFSENTSATAATLRATITSTDFANDSPARLARYRHRLKTAHFKAGKERGRE